VKTKDEETKRLMQELEKVKKVEHRSSASKSG